ncbi:DUF4333 domain-containing protein [Actinospica sp. MGRD01-02]|uniref:DUF4333 domain-containing protein n=1 Tax=Actinospica acidithermotolerans TaxID=2828514 RepID=A0A941EI81_9ACTN|nr:DUF4333 domain-containing protein [Actinospica acidithermotolerans]MBR7830898.1 DUF4333 domain-containing protein [Actinospica acidithermotolerans]
MNRILTPKRTAIGAGVVLAAVATGLVATYVFDGTESATPLDRFSTVHVDGATALDGRVVAGRILSRYHPLPWVGEKLSTVTCPGGLPARVGASIDCLGSRASGGQITIPVHVTAVSTGSVTWSFDR